MAHLTANQDRIIDLTMHYMDRLRPADREPVEYALDQVLYGATAKIHKGSARPERETADIKLMIERVMVTRIRRYLTEDEYRSIAPKLSERED